MSTRETTKLVVSTIVGFSTSFTVASVLKNNVQPKSKLQEAEVWIGSTATGLLVADMTQKSTDKYVDTIFDIFEGKKENPLIVVH
jgi:phosphate/sulfate permease